MSNSTTADSLTVTGDLTAVDVVATGCVYTANLTNTGDIAAVDVNASGCLTGTSLTIATGNVNAVDVILTGCLQGMTSASVNGNVISNADIRGIDGNFSGCITGAALSGTSLDITTGNVTAVDVILTGCLQGMTSASVDGNVISNADIRGIDGNFSGCITGAAISGTGLDITTGNITVVDVILTGCLQGMTSASVNGNIITNADVAAVDVNASGCLTGAAITGTSLDITTGNITAVDVILTGCLQGMTSASVNGNILTNADITAVVDIDMTGSLSGATAASINGALITNADVTAVDVNASGCITGAAAVLTEGITSACVIIVADNSTSMPTILSGSHVPGTGDVAWPGSLYIYTSGWDLTAGSSRANGMWYMNISASNAAGNTWGLLAGLSISDP